MKLSIQKNKIFRKVLVGNNLYLSHNKNLTLSQLRTDERRNLIEDARRPQALSPAFSYLLYHVISCLDISPVCITVIPKVVSSGRPAPSCLSFINSTVDSALLKTASGYLGLK